MSTKNDDIEASRAPLIEHLIELRSRLLKSTAAVLVCFVVCFFFASDIFNILTTPYQWAIEIVNKKDAVHLIYTAPQEYFFTQVKIALFGALFIAFPVIASQIYMFVAPGLYRNERRAFLPYLIATPILFFAGALLLYFLVLPMMLAFFLSMEQQGDATQVAIEHVPKVSEYLGLIMAMIFAFGLVFQLPVVLTLLARAGIVTEEGLRSKRRHAIVAAFVVAAILTPPDIFSQIMLALPAMLLYEVSILAVHLIKKREKEQHALPV